MCAVTVPCFDSHFRSLSVRLGARAGAFRRWGVGADGRMWAWAQVLASLSIVTNSLLVGVTSYGLYFYFPEMSIVESLW